MGIFDVFKSKKDKLEEPKVEETAEIVSDYHPAEYRDVLNSEKFENYLLSAMQEFELAEAELRENEIAEERRKLKEKVIIKYKNDERFKENCKNFGSPDEYVSAILKAMEAIYSKKPESSTEVFNLDGAGKGYIENLCLMDETKRNKLIFKEIVSIPKYIKSLKNNRKLHNSINRNQNHYYLFLKNYMDFIARDYKLGMDADELAKSYYEKYNEFQKYQKKLRIIKEQSDSIELDYRNIFNQNNVPMIETFEEYYDYPDSLSLETYIDNIIVPIVSVEIRKQQVEFISKELENNDNFKENIKKYESGPAFVAHVISQLSEIYFQTKDEAYNPNDVTYIKMYCLISEEERKENFKNAIASATENRGLK